MGCLLFSGLRPESYSLYEVHENLWYIQNNFFDSKVPMECSGYLQVGFGLYISEKTLGLNQFYNKHETKC